MFCVTPVGGVEETVYRSIPILLNGSVFQLICKYFFLIPDPRIRNPELQIRIWEAYFIKRIFVAVDT
jgi:hypothetical protein